MLLVTAMPWSPARADLIVEPTGTVDQHLDALEANGLDLRTAMGAALGLITVVERDRASHAALIARIGVLLKALVVWKDRTEVPQILLDALTVSCSSLHAAYLLERAGATRAVREVKRSNPALVEQCKAVLSLLLLSPEQQEKLRLERLAEAQAVIEAAVEAAASTPPGIPEVAAVLEVMQRAGEHREAPTLLHMGLAHLVSLVDGSSHPKDTMISAGNSADYRHSNAILTPTNAILTPS